MKAATKKKMPARPTLRAETAAELMRPNPLSLRDDASVADAIRFLADKGFSAAPVIDARGRPCGVLSRSDILIYDREKIPCEPGAEAYYGDPYLAVRDDNRGRIPNDILVRDLMTPVVFSVAPESPAADVVENMVRLNVHRLFVVDEAGTLVGVISALDVLNGLIP
jgi:CBS domain-containing protein